MVLTLCASRLLFSLHDLVDQLLNQPQFALNNVEMSRLNIRKGAKSAEFLVVVDAVERSPPPVPRMPNVRPPPRVRIDPLY